VFIRFFINKYKLLDSLSVGEEFFYNIKDNIDKGGAKHKHTYIENNFGGYLCNFS